MGEAVENKYREVIKVIDSHKKFLIVSHAHPDGDGIGSTLALGLVLKKKGKEVLMYNQDGVPHSLDFLAGADQLVKSIPKGEKFDATIMVDCAQPERAGRDFPPVEKRGVLVCIDHHTTFSDAADVVCQDEGASSTGEVVHNILKMMGAEINADIATHILTTIIVDTGFFRYSNTSSHALSIASELVAHGANTWLICRNMEERNPPEQLKLLGSVLESVEYKCGGKAAIISLTAQMLKWAGADISVAEDFINYPRSIKGVEVAVLIREKNEKEFKISFRSKEYIDVAALAGEYGGGGHKHAAGCTLNGSYGDVKQKVITALEKVFS